MNSKRKEDVFTVETESLTKAKDVANNSQSLDDLRKAFLSFCEDYEKLLDEAKFITKVSDKLESKLNKANEQLKLYNEELAHEAEDVKSKNEKITKRSVELYEQKKTLDKKTNTLQLLVILMIAMLLVAIVLILYKVLFADKSATGH